MLPAVDARSGTDPLNDRGWQAAWLAGAGNSAGDIALAMHLSPGTVRNDLSAAIGKPGAGNRIGARRPARRKGWLQRRWRRPGIAALPAWGCQRRPGAG